MQLEKRVFRDLLSFQERITGSPITLSPHTHIGRHRGIKLDTSIYSAAHWFVLVLGKQQAIKQSSPPMQITPKSPQVAALSPEAHGFPGARQRLRTQHSGGGSSVPEWLDDARERQTESFRVWSGVYRDLPTSGIFRAERGQIQHNLKSSFGQTQEHAQPGREKTRKENAEISQTGQDSRHGQKRSSNPALNGKAGLVLASLVLTHVFMPELWHWYSLLDFFTCSPRKSSSGILPSIGKYFFSFF